MKLLIIILAFIAVFLMIWGKYIWKGLTIKMTSIAYKNQILTFTYDDGSKIEYKGECTVWRRLPDFRRCSTFTESRLCDYWQLVRHHGGYIDLTKVKS